MIALLCALALGGTVQRVHELEWQRAPAQDIAAEAVDAPPEVRRAAVIALGRLHRAESLQPLMAAVEDPDPTVRAAAADALGWTQGSAPVLRAWLDRLPAPEGLAARAAGEDGVRVRAIQALGRQGNADDVARLVGHLAEPWPTSSASAAALGRLGRRQISGADAAIPALIDALSRPDPRTVESAAYALRRIGLPDGSPQAADVAAAVSRVARPQARAWLVSTALPALPSEARADLFIDAVTDPAGVVRVAALDALGSEDLPEGVVAAWVRNPDPWVRQAAVGALGRMKAVEALTRVADESDRPWDVAWAIESAGDPLGRDWTDADLPVVVRAAALATSDLDDEQLVAAAVADGPTALRTAACGVLLSMEIAPVGAAERLLGSSDVVVREAGLELLGQLDPKPQTAALLVHLRAEKDHELAANALVQLDGLLAEDPALVDPTDRYLLSALQRLASTDVARVRMAAEAVAQRLDISMPAATDSPEVREVFLPSGEVVEVARGAPILADVARIVGARVTTNRGVFTVELDPQTAPLAVSNFARLARAGFYEGVVFHRVVPGFVAQAGCPRGDGWGGPGWSLPDEVSAVPFDVGAVGMARSAPWDTGGSQWFVSTAPTPHLEGDYTRFGRVVQGMHIVRSMGRGDVVQSVEIETIEAL